MNKDIKQFILGIRDRMLRSNITESCLCFMKEHPYMFDDTASGDGKVMSINISVAIVCKEEEISTDPGFITINIDKENTYSEHFKTNRKYWNGDDEEELEESNG